MTGETHFIAYDAVAFHGQARALCGALAEGTRHATVPTCVSCLEQLAEDERAIQRLMGGTTDAAESAR